jgi:hypothetical protein
MQLLRTEFDAEKDRLITFLQKNANMKEPKVAVPSSILKGLKAMKENKREALLERYYMKCNRNQIDRFFLWRERFV